MLWYVTLWDNLKRFCICECKQCGEIVDVGRMGLEAVLATSAGGALIAVQFNNSRPLHFIIMTRCSLYAFAVSATVVGTLAQKGISSSINN